MIINKLSRVEDFITPNHFFLFSRALFIGTLNAPPPPSRGNEVGFASKKQILVRGFAKAKLGTYVLRVQKLQNASSEYPFVVRRKGDSTTIAFFTLIYAPAGAKKDTTGALTSAKQSKTFFYYPYKTNHTIVRPLITCSRRTITRTCRLSLLPVYPDVTNFKVRYSRNRIRKQIIPSIQFFFNPKVEKALFQFSEFYKKQTSQKKTGF